MTLRVFRPGRVSLENHHQLFNLRNLHLIHSKNSCLVPDFLKLKKGRQHG